MLQLRNLGRRPRYNCISVSSSAPLLKAGWPFYRHSTPYRVGQSVSEARRWSEELGNPGLEILI